MHKKVDIYIHIAEIIDRTMCILLLWLIGFKIQSKHSVVYAVGEAESTEISRSVCFITKDY